jgi:aldose 1-epimerase
METPGRRFPGLLSEPDARKLVAGDLEAVFLPGHGMLGASLRHRGAEILQRVQDLGAAAARGATAGIPLLHPWANRLADPRYQAAGRKVEIDPSSPLLHLDQHGLPMHGVPWSRLVWEVIETSQDGLFARLAWTRSELLAVFPFPHRLELAATLRSDGLTLETALVAGPEGPVPVSFGFHPYLGVPGAVRADWRLELPAMRRLPLDESGIPTGEEEPFAGLAAPLDGLDFDDGFALLDERASFSVAGAGRRISVDLLSGYPYAQVFAPKDKDYIAPEPMTAPTSALTSGRELRLVEPGGEFRAAFRIRVAAAGQPGTEAVERP